ncbi:hypothetical protein FB001_15215 [Ensifer sp. SEMIA 135]|nr:hypothetical protein FB000_15015 [Ensifer sp. SEMIA 134]TWB24033.1 hypothetical protein FB001_15215 [Ensifer sp. SEMIA 135]
MNLDVVRVYIDQSGHKIVAFEVDRFRAAADRSDLPDNTVLHTYRTMLHIVAQDEVCVIENLFHFTRLLFAESFSNCLERRIGLEEIVKVDGGVAIPVNQHDPDMGRPAVVSAWPFGKVEADLNMGGLQ